MKTIKKNFFLKKQTIVAIVAIGICSFAANGINAVINHKNLIDFTANFIIGWLIGSVITLVVLMALNEIRKSIQE